jgi:hypothetical protein
MDINPLADEAPEEFLDTHYTEPHGEREDPWERLGYQEAMHWVLLYRAGAYREDSAEAEAFRIAAARVLEEEA